MAKIESEILVFVYGTLRQGDIRNGVLQNEQLVAPVAYLQDFSMLDLGAFPGIISEDGSRVRGEVYRISQRVLDQLDRIEGINTEVPEAGLYERTEVRVETPEGETYETFVYVFNARPGRSYSVIDSGDWFEHQGLYEPALDKSITH